VLALGIREDAVVQGKTDYVGSHRTFNTFSLAGAASRLETFSSLLNSVLAVISGSSLLLMMLVVVGNGISRVVYVPFYGSTEVVGWLCAVTTAFALGYTQVHKGYVDIDILVERFPGLLQRVLRAFILAVSAVFFGLVSWQVCIYSIKVAENGNISETLGLIYYPLIFLVSLGFMGLTLALIVDFLKEAAGEAS